METLTLALIVLAAIVVSTVIERLFPFAMPAPLIQTVLGVLISLTTPFTIELEPHLFFLLFIPPLLFLDGWRIPNEELLKDKAIIVSLALGLVICTVLGAGLFINWMIPSMPLGVAFALAAIVSPTDPVAVSAIASKTPVPKKIMHILEGESLLNDASGLVAMKFAVAAVLTGTFSLVDASETFAWLAIAGIVAGVATTLVINFSKSMITRRLGHNTGAQILTSILIPFVAYMIAEHIHASGILAAVASGITMSVAEHSDRDLAITRIHRKAVWDAIYFTASGATFILLGEQLPRLISSAADIVQETGHRDPLWIIFYVVAITAVLALARFIWVKISLLLTLANARRRGQAKEWQTWRMTAVLTLAGARGTITLAGIMTLPFLLPDGSPFPARDLGILLAAGVILVSLVAASIALPVLLPKLQLDESGDREARVDRAQVLSAEAAIRAVENSVVSVQDTIDEDIWTRQSLQILDFYRNRLEEKTVSGGDVEDSARARLARAALLKVAITAEREEIFRLARARQLPDDAARKLIKDIDLFETRFLGGDHHH
ncbi:MAG: Na+/H+ antiporter [Xanthobacter sp.]